MRRVAQNASSMAATTKAASIMSTAAVSTLVAGLAGLGAQAVAAGAALAPTVGIIAMIPAASVAAVAGLSSLILAFSGIGAALKRTAGGAGASSQAIEAAERRIEMAQRAATQAQLDLNAARETAAENLRDMALSLARARLDEEAATLAVADARRNLREAQSGGDRNEIKRANLAWRESEQTLLEVRERLGDVTEESDKASAAGVEGSDEVQSALQRQADAVYELAAAQKAATSGGGGVDKAAEAYAKLSMAGRQLVDVLRTIAPAWRGVQQAVQQNALAGVAQDVNQLSTAYLPVMRTQLAAVAVGWNMAFRGSAQLAATPMFVRDTNASLANMAVMWQRVGLSLASFLSGFRHFTVVGSSFLPLFGGWVLSIGRRFDAWAASARATGKAHEWIRNAVTAFSELWAITRNVSAAIASVFAAGAAPDYLANLAAATAAFREFAASAEGQTRIREFFTTLRELGTAVWSFVKPILEILVSNGPAIMTIAGAFSIVGVAVQFLANNMSIVRAALPPLIAGFLLWKTVTMATAIVTGVMTAAQWLLNAAMYANPIGLVVLAIIALVAGIYLLWTNSAGFRDFFIGMWDAIWSFMKMIGAWFAGPFVDFFVGAWNWIKNAGLSVWNWLASIPGMLVGVFKTVTRAIASPFISAFNFIADAWNNTIGRLSWTVPSWVPFIGGNTISVPRLNHIALNLAEGGLVHARPGGVLANLAEAGEDEVVTPLSEVKSTFGPSGPVQVTLVLDSSGSEDELMTLLMKLLRKRIRVQTGGNVQDALGQRTPA